MLFMTWIARIGDGLPLAASIPEDEEVHYCNIFNMLFLLICLYCYFFNDCNICFYLFNFKVGKRSHGLPKPSENAFPETEPAEPVEMHH